MSAARSELEGPARRVRLLRAVRGDVLVLPALVCVGVVLGLAFGHSGGGSNQALQQDEVPREPAPSSLPPSTAEANRDLPPPAVISPRPDRALGTPAPLTDVGSSRPHQSPNAVSEGGAASASAFPVYDESAVTLGDANRVPAEASGAPEANARATHLRQIDGSSSPESLPLLEQTLRTDAISRNRLLAVNSLRLLGKQAGNAERVQAALRAAMSDTDENVASSARDAYQELRR